MNRNSFNKKLLTGLTGLAVAAAAAGCGSSGGSANASSADTQACMDKITPVVDQHKQEVQWKSPGPAFDASSIKGKTVYWISGNAEVPFSQKVFAGFKEAADKVGVKYNFFNGDGSAATMLRGFQQAIAAHADVIMIQSIPLETFKTQIAVANEAGIPIVEAWNTDAGEAPEPGTQAAVTYDFTRAGQMMAAAAIKISKCNVKAVTFSPSDDTIAKYEVSGIKGEFEKYCPDTCSTTEQFTRISEWSTRLPVLARNAVSNPAVNWLMPVYDGQTQFTNPAVMQAGAASRVNVASFNATQGIIDQLAQSGNPLAVDVGAPLAWSGWAIADQCFRLLAGEKPVVDENIPLRTFDRDNIDEIDLSKPDATWYGTNTDFQAEYLKLWKVG
ncbi:sugar ABC transporter substrate-binding protein [Kribbella sp. NPDC050124]|uniref:sugar ABC transporter substrate-binding protein n=1 Tax=Kribbella sp. NPDC050124 TaxID=3364114 RepID=UPI0037A02C8F